MRTGTIGCAWLAAAAMIMAVAPASTAPMSSGLLHRFEFDGTRGITDEEHLGIVGGRLTAGVSLSDVAGLRGIWAPPYVSSDFVLSIRVSGRTTPADTYRWLPHEIVRHARARGIRLETRATALSGLRAVVVRIAFTNEGRDPLRAPVELAFAGTLDRSDEWGFARPSSHSQPQVERDGKPDIDACEIWSRDGVGYAVRIVGMAGAWSPGGSVWRSDLRLPAKSTGVLHAVIAFGERSSVAAECRSISKDPEKARTQTLRIWRRRASDLFEKVPRLEADDPRLVSFYLRSLVHLLTNRWDVPEFVLNPYYSTGSIKGGCVCSYLWNYGEVWEILPLYDPPAARAHILHFLKCDMTTHFAFDPLSGAAFGPWYMVNQEKIIGSVYHYVAATGDVAFLGTKVNDRTVLEHVLANAVHMDDLSKPVAMVDYGPSNSHLELRRGLPYNHVMPDLNGRRFMNYVWASRLAALCGNAGGDLSSRADQLRRALKRDLWDADPRWFAFVGPDGKRDLRYTIQVFKLLGSGVLDREQEEGLLSHLNEAEFLSPYGIHSMSKLDTAYDQVDIDNGGGGACTCFPPQVIEKLYRAGHPDTASGILERILWWGERMPYWGDSIVANAVDYRKDTPLQCTLDGATGAQALIYGMFGIEIGLDGTITVSPQPPAFSRRIALRGLRIRGRKLDVIADMGNFAVRIGAKTLRSRVGIPIVISP